MLSIEAVSTASEITQTILDKGVKPLSLSNGLLKFYTPAGSIQSQYLTTHSYLNNYKGREDKEEGHLRYLLQNLSLCKFNNCLKAAEVLHNAVVYDVLGKKSLEYVELDVALKCF